MKPAEDAQRVSGTRSAAVKQTLRHLGTGAAALALIHAALLGVTPGDEPYVDLSPLFSESVLDQIRTMAPWLLMAVTLLWLAHRRPAVYTRAAIALLLASTAGLVFAGSASVPALPEGSLVHDYLTLPGASVGWCLLAAFAVTSGTERIRARIAVMVVAAAVVATAVLTPDRRMLSAVWAAGVPMIAWSIAGLVQRPATRSRGSADAWEPEGRTVPFRPREEAAGQRPAPLPVPLRKAG